MKAFSRVETVTVLSVAVAAWTVAISAARDMIEAHGLIVVLLG